MRTVQLSSLLLASTLACSTYAQPLPLRYRMQLFADMNPVGINNRGQICGWTVRNDAWGHPHTRVIVRDFDGAFREPVVSIMSGEASLPISIAESGEIAGTTGVNGNREPFTRIYSGSAVKWSASLVPTVIRPNVWPSNSFALHAISGGFMVGNGWIVDPDGRLRTLDANSVDVDSQGTVLFDTGRITYPDGTSRTAIGLTGACGTSFSDLNNVRGIVAAGFTRLGCDPIFQITSTMGGVMLPNFDMIPIAELPGGGTWVQPHRMNDSYCVVGSDRSAPCLGCDTETRAFLFSPTLGTIDLNGLVTNLPTALVINDAVDINNWGAIAAISSMGPCILVPDVDCVTPVVHPQSICASPGTTVSIIAAFISPSPATFQWYKDGSPMIDEPGIIGATRPTLLIESMTTADVGSYHCVATAECGSASTAPAAVQLPRTLVIVEQPQNQAVASSSSITFSVVARRTNDCHSLVKYAWQRRDMRVPDETAAGAWVDLHDGGEFINTATAAFTILHSLPSMTGPFRCRIVDPCGCDSLVTDSVDFSVACPADFNADGGVDFTDIEAFFERWENGC